MASQTLYELAAVVGWPGAKAMCAWWGGQRLYVPKQAPRDGPLVELLGEVLATRISDRFGGDYLELPMPDVAAARRTEVRRMVAASYSTSEISRALGITQRRVKQIFAELAVVEDGSVSP
jgi:hypothetical protein